MSASKEELTSVIRQVIAASGLVPTYSELLDRVAERLHPLTESEKTHAPILNALGLGPYREKLQLDEIEIERFHEALADLMHGGVLLFKPAWRSAENFHLQEPSPSGTGAR